MGHAARLKIETLENRLNLSTLAGATTVETALSPVTAIQAAWEKVRIISLDQGGQESSGNLTVRSRPSRTLHASPTPSVGATTLQTTISANVTQTPTPTGSWPLLSQSGKIVLNGTNYTGVPDGLTTASGQSFTKVVVNSYWLNRIVTVKPNGKVTTVSTWTLQESGCRYLAHFAVDRGAQAIIVDLENPWPTPENCTQALTWIRDELSKMGVSLPISFWDAPHVLLGPPNVVDMSAQNIANTQAIDNGLIPLANSLDFLSPVFYYTQNSVADWQRAAQWDLDEARRMAPGKKIVPFLCPRYVTGPKNGQLLPAAIWNSLVQWAQQNSDGVTIWDPCTVSGDALPWSSAANSWWSTVRTLS